jgi:endonuclease G
MTSLLARIAETEARFKGRAAQRAVIHDDLEPMGPVRTKAKETLRRRLERSGFGKLAEVIAESGDITYDKLPELSTPELNLLERIIGRNNLVDFDFVERALLAGRAVGRIALRRNTHVAGYGTGFLISPRLVMTNHHVLESEAVAREASIELDYQLGLDGRPLPTTTFAFDPAALFLASEDLDYAVVAVKEEEGGPPLARFGAVRLAPSDANVRVEEPLNIIQHPNGEMKQVALRDNRAIDLPAPYVHYESDTAPGSSGSPVFNELWEVVALHRSGVPKRDAAGRILARDGSLWRESMGEHRIDWIANEGVLMASILADLLARARAGRERDLIDGIVTSSSTPEVGTPAPLLLSGQPAAASATIPQVSLIPAAQPLAAPSPEQPVASLARDGAGGALAITVSLPIEVTVRVGVPVVQAPPGEVAPGRRS